jgi:hypothetical protein
MKFFYEYNKDKMCEEFTVMNNAQTYASTFEITRKASDNNLDGHDLAKMLEKSVNRVLAATL